MKNTIILIVSIILSILVGLQVGLYQMNKQTDKWDERYQSIEKDVSTFVDVSNPKTIRLYTKELRDILDNMSRLSKIIDKGEEIDITLGKIMDGIDQLEDQWDVTLSNDIKMKETIDVVKNNISEDKTQLMSILDDELDDIDTRITKQFDQIENDLRDIRNMLTQIENSKVGKKIFN
tara:strand:- start:484 stop:1014 length:531 start_codon:yes stop_codon:yes gene_type:complete